jgi:hypothetical protein
MMELRLIAEFSLPPCARRSGQHDQTQPRSSGLSPDEVNRENPHEGGGSCLLFASTRLAWGTRVRSKRLPESGDQPLSERAVHGMVKRAAAKAGITGRVSQALSAGIHARPPNRKAVSPRRARRAASSHGPFRFTLGSLGRNRRGRTG